MEKQKVHAPKRRRSVKKHTPAKRRRRIGAVAMAKKKGATADLMNVLMVAGGAIGGSFLDKLIPADWDVKMKGGIKIAAGIFLPQLVKDPKTKHTMQLLGYGLAANGGIQLATGFNLISGVGAVGQLKDDDLLVVSLDGIDDRLLDEQKKPLGEYAQFEDVLNDDILNDGNINVVQEDNSGNIPVVEDDILNAMS